MRKEKLSAASLMALSAMMTEQFDMPSFHELNARYKFDPDDHICSESTESHTCYGRMMLSNGTLEVKGTFHPKMKRRKDKLTRKQRKAQRNNHD